MNQGHYINHANEIRRMKDIIAKLERENEALKRDRKSLMETLAKQADELLSFAERSL